jgi:hypothetical protein
MLLGEGVNVRALTPSPFFSEREPCQKDLLGQRRMG